MEISESICIVDDNADYCRLTLLSIQQADPNYAVTTFTSGLAFLNALSQMSQLPRLVLLDRHMPDFNGHQTLVCLKQHPNYKRIPVVMMSADASREEIRACYESGANSFLLKNMDATLQRETVLVACRYWVGINQ